MVDAPLEACWHRTVGDGIEVHRIPPDGCVDLIAIVEGGTITPHVYGPTSVYDDVELEPGLMLVGIRFLAGVGPLVLDVPGIELAGRMVALDDVMPSAARALRDTDPSVAAIEARLVELAAALAASARQGIMHDRVAQAIAALAAGSADIGDVARSLGVTERTLHRDFLTAVGLPPKRYARVARARCAAAALGAGARPIDVALRCGYADQAHLTREMVALHGLTPGSVRNIQDRAHGMR